MRFLLAYPGIRALGRRSAVHPWQRLLGPRGGSVCRRRIILHRARQAGVALLAAVLSSCSDSGVEPQSFLFTFDTDAEGWETGFADYPIGASAEEQGAIDAFFELEGAHAAMPPPLDSADGAVRLSGNNHSDALFMFLKRRVTGLVPDTRYQLELSTIIATNVPRGCFGIGGSPGESVHVKGGATTIEPMRLSNGSLPPDWVMNVDKGGQADGGADAQVIGDFANSKECDSSDYTYELKTLSNRALAPFHVTTDANGEAWLLLGTDSGFEGTTTIYYTEVEAMFLR